MALRRIVLALAVSAASACGGAAPNDPGFPVPPPPSTAPPIARAMPAPVLSRFQQPITAPSSPKRESITEPPPGLPLPKVDEERVARQSPAEPRPPLPTDTLPDEVVMRLLESGRAAFVRCFKKARNEDPSELSFKVKLRVELDADGSFSRASTDAHSAALDTCLTRMAAWLKFPAAGKPIAVELPLFYQAN
ncbi:MAG TPA: hypothetical protein VMZ53_29485 [Kofleriaceae bacterium]|nr:hypothetical protein [Kofleriaceae bacterium]